jgi:drug/metabolite transporter (DMT)-like permease
MIGLFPAVMLSIAAAASHALAAVVQERLAARLLRESLTMSWRRGSFQLLRRRRWWIAVGLSATAAVLHVLALRYGPLTVVQPLGALTLVLALPLSAVVVGRRVTRTEWRGACMTLAGLTGLLLLAASGAPTTTLDSDEIVVLTSATGVALIIITTWASTMSKSIGRSLGYATAAGISFGVSSALTQTVTLEVSGEGIVGLLSTASVVIVVLVTCGLLFSQAAYRAGLGAPLATVSSVNPITAAVIGVVLLGERYAAGATGAALTLMAAASAAYGVVQLAGPVSAVQGAAPHWGPCEVAERGQD